MSQVASQTSFDYGTLHIGDLVEVSTQLDFREPCAGWISEVAADCCNINVISQHQMGTLWFCWHENDPRCEEPDRFEAAQRLLSGPGQPAQTGVFRMSNNQKLLDTLPQRFEGVERMLQELLRRVAELERAKMPEPPKSAEPPPVRRGPGRPRKRLQTTEEAAGVS